MHACIKYDYVAFNIGAYYGTVAVGSALVLSTSLGTDIAIA